MNLSEVISATILIIIAIMLSITFYFRHKEQKQFNKGVCIECKVPLQKVGTHGKIRVYYCPKCHSLIPVYFNVDKNIALEKFKMTEDEDEEETVNPSIVS